MLGKILQFSGFGERVRWGLKITRVSKVHKVNEDAEDGEISTPSKVDNNRALKKG